MAISIPPGLVLVCRLGESVTGLCCNVLQNTLPTSAGRSVLSRVYGQRESGKQCHAQEARIISSLVRKMRIDPSGRADSRRGGLARADV